MIKDYGQIVQKLQDDPIPRLKTGIKQHLDAYLKTGHEYDLKAVVELIDRLICERQK